MLLLAILLLGSCAPYQHRTVFGVTFTSGSTSSGGLMRIHADGTAEPLPPSGKVIDLPISAGYLNLRYDPPYSEGTYRTMEQWFVDGQLRQQTDRNFYGFSYGFEGGGTHDVRLIVFWAYAGDRHSAGTDTLQVRVRSWRDFN
ncbi:MAG: hypothetical protein Q8O51_01930 [bacterium]|nr:hypothetical protein [bacterium]